MRVLRIALLLALAAYWLTIAVLTHLPKVRGLPQVGDKTTHFLGFAVLGVLIYGCVLAWRRGSPWTGLFVLIVVALYGTLDELTQPLTGRTCSFLDWMADMSGAAAAVIAMGGMHWAIVRGRSHLAISARPH